MIRIAVFDLDGTLVDSLTDLALSVNDGLRSAGLPEHPVSAYRRFVGNGRAMLIRRAVGENGGEEQCREVLAVFDASYRRRCGDHTVAYEGCAGMLHTLSAHGIETAVLSNKPDEFLAPILQKVYPDHRFLEAWGQKPPFPCKPDRQALRAMLAAHAIAPEDCVYIGDSDVDVLTAQNSGVRMAGVAWGFRGREELTAAGAPFVAENAAELTAYLLCL